MKLKINIYSIKPLLLWATTEHYSDSPHNISFLTSKPVNTKNDVFEMILIWPHEPIPVFNNESMIKHRWCCVRQFGIHSLLKWQFTEIWNHLKFICTKAHLPACGCAKASFLKNNHVIKTWNSAKRRDWNSLTIA